MARAERSRKVTHAPAPPSAKDDSNWTVIFVVTIWMVALMAFVMLMIWPSDTAGHIVLAVLATAPLALALTLVMLFRREVLALRQSLNGLRAQMHDLHSALQTGPIGSTPASPIAQSKIDALAAAQEQTDTRLTLFLSRRGRADAAPLANPTADNEPLLALDDGALADTPALNTAELIRALHFPEDENDTDGFEALRKGLADSRTSNLIRAAQEVLTHLAQEGIYMDDLRPDRARPEFWRAFAAGTRGTLIAPLGGIRDRSCLALTAARMRANPEFKSTAHLFLREFDKVFAAFEKEADDAQIAALSETRSARAFMLLGRVSGVFSR